MSLNMSNERCPQKDLSSHLSFFAIEVINCWRMLLEIVSWMRRSHLGYSLRYCPQIVPTIIFEIFSWLLSLRGTKIRRSKMEDHFPIVHYNKLIALIKLLIMFMVIPDTKDSPAFLLKPITLNVSTISSPDSLFSSPSSPGASTISDTQRYHDQDASPQKRCFWMTRPCSLFAVEENAPWSWSSSSSLPESSLLDTPSMYFTWTQKSDL